jgi:steroid delta-isomerase-like uncharacterized protein
MGAESPGREERPAPHPVACGTIPHVTSRPDAPQHLRDLAWLRRVRDRIDREYELPLDVEALARGAHMSAGWSVARAELEGRPPHAAVRLSWVWLFRRGMEARMAQDENRGLVRDYYEAVYNRRELGRLDAFLAPGFVSAGPGGRMDREAHATALAASLAAMPDLRLAVVEQITEGDAVVTRWTATGTQLGPLFGIPPTGRRVTATAIHIHRLRDGRIVDQWEQFDTLGVLGQLGLVPRPAQELA